MSFTSAATHGQYQVNGSPSQDSDTTSTTGGLDTTATVNTTKSDDIESQFGSRWLYTGAQSCASLLRDTLPPATDPSHKAYLQVINDGLESTGYRLVHAPVLERTSGFLNSDIESRQEKIYELQDELKNQEWRIEKQASRIRRNDLECFVQNHFIENMSRELWRTQVLLEQEREKTRLLIESGVQPSQPNGFTAADIDSSGSLQESYESPQSPRYSSDDGLAGADTPVRNDSF